MKVNIENVSISGIGEKQFFFLDFIEFKVLFALG